MTESWLAANIVQLAHTDFIPFDREELQAAVDNGYLRQIQFMITREDYESWIEAGAQTKAVSVTGVPNGADHLK